MTKITATVAAQHWKFTSENRTLPPSIIALTKEIPKRKVAPINSSSPFNPPNRQRHILFIGHSDHTQNFPLHDTGEKRRRRSEGVAFT